MKKCLKLSCDQCDLKFMTLRNLKRHKLIHTGTKKHACDRCDFKCDRLDKLKNHQKCAKKAKIQSFCGVCRLVFCTKISLALHKNSEHKNIKYSCDKCDANFKSLGNLQNHQGD